MWKMQFDRPVTKAKQKSEWIVNPNPHSRYVGVQPISQNTPESIQQASMILQSLSLNSVDNWFQIILRRLVNGVFQDSCHSLVNFYAASLSGLSGFNVTAPIASQS